MQEIVQVINTVGFPIACVIACGYFIYKTTQQNREDNKEREDKMYEQLDKFGDNLSKFNDTLNKIDSRLEAVERAIDSKVV